jgi:hypothetical protein
MLADCFFCGSELPDPAPNHLEAGDRLAFDPRLGRLWQVCARCRRWNLTPIESRWEIVEECERLSRPSQLLLKTEHLMLLSVGVGQLIRVGTPARGEFAEWRYSSTLDSYLRGRAGLQRAFLSLPELPVGGYDFYGTTYALPQPWIGSPFIEHGALLSALFLNVPFAERCPSCGDPLFIHPAAFGDLRFHRVSGGTAMIVPCGLCGEQVLVSLPEARPAVRAGLALVSHKYRRVAHVDRAVRPLDRIGGPQELLTRLCAKDIAIGELRKPARLALWIALDELAETEALEDEWRMAESLAQIADNELTQVPGFDEFKLRVLSETPR